MGKYVRSSILVNLATCTQDEVIDFARLIYSTYNDTAKSLEEMAQYCVHEVFGEFQDDDGTPAFALLRIFRVGQSDELPSDLSTKVDDSNNNWLTLMATVGLEAEWCDRRTSKNHQIRSIDEPLTPLMQAVFDQIGMQINGSGIGISMFSPQQHSEHRGFFYEADAANSPYFESEDNFINRYGIKSVVAVGSPFQSGAAGIMVGFSQVHIPLDQACYFANMGVYIFTLLSQHDGKRIWA